MHISKSKKTSRRSYVIRFLIFPMIIIQQSHLIYIVHTVQNVQCWVQQQDKWLKVNFKWLRDHHRHRSVKENVQYISRGNHFIQEKNEAWRYTWVRRTSSSKKWLSLCSQSYYLLRWLCCFYILKPLSQIHLGWIQVL